MYELIQAGKRTFYMEGYARAGIYVFGKDSACAIDTGADEHAGLALLKHLKSMNLRLELIINTHSHSDHTGGNALLKGLNYLDAGTARQRHEQIGGHRA